MEDTLPALGQLKTSGSPEVWAIEGCRAKNPFWATSWRSAVFLDLCSEEISSVGRIMWKEPAMKIKNQIYIKGSGRGWNGGNSKEEQDKVCPWGDRKIVGLHSWNYNKRESGCILITRNVLKIWAQSTRAISSCAQRGIGKADPRRMRTLHPCGLSLCESCWQGMGLWSRQFPPDHIKVAGDYFVSAGRRFI